MRIWPFETAPGLIPTYAGNTLGGSHLPGIPSGLIPTYAGNTKIFDTKPGGARAHPHVCGEHAIWRLLFVMRSGSSPRMRGTRTGVSPKTARRGLIPTYAGNTERKSVR